MAMVDIEDVEDMAEVAEVPAWELEEREREYI